jgi:hypothetical protein
MKRINKFIRFQLFLTLSTDQRCHVVGWILPNWKKRSVRNKSRSHSRYHPEIFHTGLYKARKTCDVSSFRANNSKSVTCRIWHRKETWSICSVAQQPNPSLARLIVGAFYITHNDTHTQTVGHLWTSDQLVTEAASYTTRKKHNRRTSMPPRGISTRNSSKQAASDLCLRPHCDQDRPINL